MAIIGQFGHWKFEVSSNYVRSFKNLQIIGECETEDKTADSQKYVSAKNGKPIQITMTVTLCAYLGVDVHQDVVDLINTAQRSGQGYFYVQSKKLFPFMLMLTKADVKNIKLSPSGQWISCDVALTLKQSSKEWILGTSPSSGSGGSQSSGNGNGGGETKKSSGSKKATTKTQNTVTKIPMTGVSTKSIAAVAAARAKKTTSTAKSVSASTKTSSAKQKTSSIPAKKVRIMKN